MALQTLSLPVRHRLWRQSGQPRFAQFPELRVTANRCRLQPKALAFTFALKFLGKSSCFSLGCSPRHVTAASAISTLVAEVPLAFFEEDARHYPVLLRTNGRTCVAFHCAANALISSGSKRRR